MNEISTPPVWSTVEFLDRQSATRLAPMLVRGNFVQCRTPRRVTNHCPSHTYRIKVGYEMRLIRLFDSQVAAFLHFSLAQINAITWIRNPLVFGYNGMEAPPLSLWWK
jgi:hypothetical protein